MSINSKVDTIPLPFSHLLKRVRYVIHQFLIVVSIIVLATIMSTFKERFQQILNETPIDANPPAIYQQHQHFRPSFLEYLKSAENKHRKGYNLKFGKWYPHPSHEGGTDTIGYGHKLKPGENFTKGLTEDQVIALLNQDVEFARQVAKREVDSHYGDGMFDQLPIQRQEMLTDFAFNLGSLRSFPKFTRAVLLNDLVTMQKEYERYSGGQALTARNRLFYDRYIKDLTVPTLKTT